MNTSTMQGLGERIVAEIFDLLREDRLALDIDLPIDRVLYGFPTPSSFPITQPEFIETLSHLVRLIYREAVALPRDVSPDDARTEAFWILEMAYYRSGPDFYDVAWLCAESSKDGLIAVLRRVAETIKALERDKYRNCVFASRINLLSWSERCEIARALRDNYHHLLQPSLAAQSPGELADDIRPLIEEIKRGESDISQITGGAISLAKL